MPQFAADQGAASDLDNRLTPTRLLFVFVTTLKDVARRSMRPPILWREGFYRCGPSSSGAA